MQRQLELLKARLTDPDVEWQDINDLRASFYKEAESRDTTRKGSKLLYEYMEAGWVSPPITLPSAEKESVAINKDGSMTLEKEFVDIDPDTLKDPRTLMLAHGYDPDKFKLLSSKNSSWTVGGRTQTSSKIVVSPLEQTAPSKEELEQWFSELARNYAPMPVEHKHDDTSEDILVIPFSDLHFGLKASNYRTGNEYSMGTARKVLWDAVNNILSSTNYRKFKQIVLTIGGDMINADNIAGTTTRGTAQDNDGDYFSICKELYNTMVGVTEELLIYAPLHIIYIPGNHDKTVSYQLAQYLKAWHRNNSKVTIDDSPFPRKYFMYGKTLMMFSHDGDLKRLPQLVADEARQMWSQINFTEVFLQHLHSEQVLLESNHMRIQRLPTLSGSSAWSVDQGYRSQRQHKSFVYDKDGLKTVLYTRA